MVEEKDQDTDARTLSEKPLRRIPYQGQYPDQPEFQKPWEHVQVGQGDGKTSSDTALISEGLGLCFLVFLKNLKTGNSGLLHIEDAEINQVQASEINRLGSKKDLRAIILEGEVSYPIIRVQRQLAKRGIDVVRVINVDTGEAHFAACYRPKQDEILLQNKKNHELQVFRGFGA